MSSAYCVAHCDGHADFLANIDADVNADTDRNATHADSDGNTDRYVTYADSHGNPNILLDTERNADGHTVRDTDRRAVRDTVGYTDRDVYADCGTDATAVLPHLAADHLRYEGEGPEIIEQRETHSYHPGQYHRARFPE